MYLTLLLYLNLHMRLVIAPFGVEALCYCGKLGYDDCFLSRNGSEFWDFFPPQMDMFQMGLFLSLTVQYLARPIRAGFSPHKAKCQELPNYSCNWLELAISTQLESESKKHINRQM